MSKDRKIVNLGTHRATKAGDNSKWTPEECAEQFLADIRSGEIKPDRLFLMYWEPTDDGGFYPCSYTQNLCFSEELAMLEIEKKQLFQRWME